MNKKHTLKKTAALLLALGLTVGATGCDFILTDSEKDLAQIVATVDITDNLSADTEYAAYAASVDALIANGGLTTDVPKRDLVAYFMSMGITYVQNYGYTYEQTFTQLMDMLVNRKILTQYAVAYYLKNGFKDGETVKTVSSDECVKYVDEQIAAATGTEKALLEAHPAVLTMKYFLTEGGNTAKMDDYNAAVYSLQKSLNNSLDSAEANYITATSDSHDHSDVRTTPTNANTEKSDYIPLKEDGTLNYGVYTGRTTEACGAYEQVDGSTATTRMKAYNVFLSNLQGYGLIKENEDTKSVTQLDYYYVELTSTLEQALINKYYEDLTDKAIESLSQTYVEGKYAEIYDAQALAYGSDVDAFDTALDSLSDTAFTLYGKQDFGFVYNILIPFSASQEMAYSAEKNKGLTQDDTFKARKKILESVTAKDLRDTWLCTDEHANYSYEVTAANDGDYFKATAGSKGYLFFENNFTDNEKYEKLTQYAGKYAYNGTVTLENDEYTCVPNKLTIDGFITEMEEYIDYIVGADVTSGATKTSYNADTYSVNGVVDYSKFVYYEGKVNVAFNAANYFKADDAAYKALSAVNELMFAYSTDTGCLNTYMGYAVSPYKTDFVSEFEYAAQYVVKQGVGSYVVAPSDYGWHIIYCSFAYNEGDVYGGFKYEEKDTEGTFSNLFYESLKSTSATNYTTDVESNILNAYKTSATRYTDRYQDLLDLDE